MAANCLQKGLKHLIKHAENPCTEQERESTTFHGCEISSGSIAMRLKILSIYSKIDFLQRSGKLFRTVL